MGRRRSSSSRRVTRHCTIAASGGGRAGGGGGGARGRTRGSRAGGLAGISEATELIDHHRPRARPGAGRGSAPWRAAAAAMPRSRRSWLRTSRLERPPHTETRTGCSCRRSGDSSYTRLRSGSFDGDLGDHAFGEVGGSAFDLDGPALVRPRHRQVVRAVTVEVRQPCAMADRSPSTASDPISATTSSSTDTVTTPSSRRYGPRPWSPCPVRVNRTASPWRPVRSQVMAERVVAMAGLASSGSSGGRSP